MIYLQSGCLCNTAFAMATPSLLGFDTSQLQLRFYFLLINNGRRGFLITKQDAPKHITVTAVVAIVLVKALVSEGQAKSERSTGRERSSSAAFTIVLKLESLKLKLGMMQFDP